MHIVPCFDCLSSPMLEVRLGYDMNGLLSRVLCASIFSACGLARYDGVPVGIGRRTQVRWSEGPEDIAHTRIVSNTPILLLDPYAMGSGHFSPANSCPVRGTWASRICRTKRYTGERSMENCGLSAIVSSASMILILANILRRSW